MHAHLALLIKFLMLVVSKHVVGKPAFIYWSFFVKRIGFHSTSIILLNKRITHPIILLRFSPVLMLVHRQWLVHREG